MAILDGLEILLEDASSQVIPDFHNEDSHASSTVRCVARCVEVANGQHCSFNVRTLPDFQWHSGDCLRLVLDFDTGEAVNRYDLYLVKDRSRTRHLVNKERVLRRATFNDWHESTIKYLYLLSDISDKYCQKGRLVFRNLREDAERPGGRKTVQQNRKDQGRIRIEVTRLHIRELSVAEEIVLLRPPKRGRTQKDVLEKKGIHIETRVELDDHYECLPKQKFATRPLETTEGKKQLNFVFEYRTKGIFEAYCSSGSEVDDSNITADTSNLAPESIHPHESQALVQPRDKQPLGNLISSTAEQESTTQTAFDDDAETIAEEEYAREAQEARIVNTGTVIDSHAVPDQKLNATPIKLEDDETPHTGENTASGTWLTGQGREYAQPTRNIATSNGTMATLSPTDCQDLLTRIRVAESLIEAEQQRMERDDATHEELLASLKETELGYREARYLQRQEQKRERQTIIARIEAVNHRIEQEKQLFEAERVRLVALLESQEKVLIEMKKNNNSGSELLQQGLQTVSTTRPCKRRRDG